MPLLLVLGAEPTLALERLTVLVEADAGREGDARDLGAVVVVLAPSNPSVTRDDDEEEEEMGVCLPLAVAAAFPPPRAVPLVEVEFGEPGRMCPEECCCWWCCVP